MRRRATGERLVAATVAVVAMSIAACSGGGDDGEDASPPADAAEASSPGDATGADGTGAGGGGSGRFGCPLTAEEVGEVFGTSVEKDEATCSYAPGGEVGAIPSALFVAQMTVLCDEEFATQIGYTDRVEGLEVDAFLKTGGGATASVFVCGGAPFEVVVDVGTDTATGVAAAETLALMALEAG